MERQARAGYGVSILLILLGCALFAAGAASMVPLPKRPLLIGTNLWIGYEPFHLIRAEGGLPQDVTLVEARSSPSLMEAVAAGSLDGAALTLDEVLRLEAAGQPMVVLAVLDVSHGADVILARSREVLARGPAGARIGVETEGVGAFVLHRFLEYQGLSPAQVQILPVPVGDHADAMARLALDYIVSYEPLVSRLEMTGAIRVFDSAQMPGDVIDVLAIRRDRVAGRDATLRRLLSAWYRGVAMLSHGEAAWMQRVSRRQGLPEMRVREVMMRLVFPDPEGSRALLAPGNAVVPRMQRWLMATDGIGSVPEPRLDLSLLPD